MTAKEIIKETIIDTGKTAYNFGFDILNTVSDHGEQVLRSTLDRAAWIPGENRKAVDAWLEAVRNGQKNLKAVLDENLNTFEHLIGGI